jgi:hypothetical protein
VKKSKESRRIAKEKKKEKKQSDAEIKIEPQISVKSEDLNSVANDQKPEEISFNEIIRSNWPLDLKSKDLVH